MFENSNLKYHIDNVKIVWWRNEPALLFNSYEKRGSFHFNNKNKIVGFETLGKIHNSTV